jgi:hypothetical protein
VLHVYHNYSRHCPEETDVWYSFCAAVIGTPDEVYYTTVSKTIEVAARNMMHDTDLKGLLTIQRK